ncbi:hypothetical protein VAEKB19_5290009 [Vibrio aestuarianus]|nr:hypothetical protein VAEKB19_5290009 [Vibrio aestuarianus]
MPKILAKFSTALSLMSTINSNTGKTKEADYSSPYLIDDKGSFISNLLKYKYFYRYNPTDDKRH